MGQQFLDSVCRVGLDPNQYVGQIRDRVDPVHFARRDECIKHSKVFTRFAVGNEEKSDTSESDPTQSRLSFVVIGRNCRVAQKASEGAAIFKQVPDRSRDSRFWFESVSMFSSPYKQSREEGARFFFSQSKMSVGSDDFCFLVTASRTGVLETRQRVLAKALVWNEANW
jgi:hypothetical protein